MEYEEDHLGLFVAEFVEPCNMYCYDCADKHASKSVVVHVVGNPITTVADESSFRLSLHRGYGYNLAQSTEPVEEFIINRMSTDEFKKLLKDFELDSFKFILNEKFKGPNRISAYVNVVKKYIENIRNFRREDDLYAQGIECAHVLGKQTKNL